MTRDRYGEPLEDVDAADAVPAPRPPGHHCDAGWLDRDADRPRPCLICRPWLAERRSPHHDEIPAVSTNGEP